MRPFIEQDIQGKGDYKTLLTIMSKLSGLFSDSAVPYLYYRAAENIFCKCFNAKNLSRADVAYDAQIGNTGIGLKTFICNGNSSVEKVAEFNALSSELKQYSGLDLAYKLAEFRNERINLANRLYNIDNALYHIVARNKEKELILFETDYQPIDIDSISLLPQHSVKNAGLQFKDKYHQYNFNFF